MKVPRPQDSYAAYHRYMRNAQRLASDAIMRGDMADANKWIYAYRHHVDNVRHKRDHVIWAAINWPSMIR